MKRCISYLTRAKLILLTVVALLIGSVTAVAAKDKALTARYVSNKIVIKLKHSLPAGQKSMPGIFAQSSLASVSNLNTVFRIKKIEALFPGSETKSQAAGLELSRFYRFTFPDDVNLQEVLPAYEQDPNIEFVQVIGLHPLLDMVPDDPEYFRQWGLAQIQVSRAWDLAVGDTSVILAIIDSGVDWMHPDLGGPAPFVNGNIWINRREYHGVAGVDDDNNGYVDDIHGWDWVDGATVYTGEDGNTADNDPMDFYGHGTHVAGIAAAIGNNGIGVAGLSWRCKIMPLRAGYAVSRQRGEVDMSFCAQAIYYAVNMGATAINCSWASSNSGGIKAALDYARERGVLILASAGNEALSDAYYLSSRPEVITVAGTNNRDQKTSSSNFGYWVDVAAPGETIFSTITGLLSESGNAGYKNLSGTSMATPFVTGLAGLLKSRQPDLSAVKIRSIILQSVKAIDDLNSNYANGKLGEGRIDAYQALTLPEPEELTIIFSEDFSLGLPKTWQADPFWRADDPGQRNANSDDKNNPGTIHVGYDIWDPPFMIVDSDWAGAVAIDAALTTPAIDCQYYRELRLVFDNWFQPYNGGSAEVGAIQVSIDDKNWHTVAQFNSFPNFPTNNVDAGRDCVVRLPGFVDHQKQLRLRFHYFNANYDWFWGIDNVRIMGSAESIGVITGRVTDATTGKPVANASIAADTLVSFSDSTGGYRIILAPGTYSLSCQANNYESQRRENIVISQGSPTTQDFRLRAAHIAVAPNRIDTIVGQNDSLGLGLMLFNQGLIDLRVNRITATLNSKMTSSIMNAMAGANDWPWLTINPDSGQIAPGDSMLVQLCLKSEGLNAGDYNFTLNIASNDPDDPVLAVPGQLKVLDYPFGHQELRLRTGWNLISWRLDTGTDSISDFFRPVLADVGIVLGFDNGALTFDPALARFSNLIQVDHLHGYWVKMRNPGTWRINGIPASDTLKRALTAGWNLVSYWPAQPDSTIRALQSVLPNLVIALGFEGGGLAFDPRLPDASTLTVLKPGLGYWLKLSAADTLQYPQVNSFARTARLLDSDGQNLALTPTNTWINVYADRLELDGQELKPGSEIRAVSQSGVLCGQGRIGANGQLRFMPVYGDDPATEIQEGAVPGEKIDFFLADRLWLGQIRWHEFGAVLDLISVTTGAQLPDPVAPQQFDISQNYPNPFSLARKNASTLFRYQIAQPVRARIVICNVLGQTIRVLTDGIKTAGSYQIYWDGTDARGQKVANGVYLYRLETDHFVQTRKMLVLR